jgi:hypothetical protein
VRETIPNIHTFEGWLESYRARLRMFGHDDFISAEARGAASDAWDAAYDASRAAAVKHMTGAARFDEETEIVERPCYRCGAMFKVTYRTDWQRNTLSITGMHKCPKEAK